MSDMVVLREPAADPAELGYPPTLPVEVALRTAPIRDICTSYGITREQWAELRDNPDFQTHVGKILEELRKDGGLGFRLKARLQSEELLKTSWRLIHKNDTPSSVKADLIKFTVRAAGLDGSKDQAANAAPANALQININL
jgi:hypothetical protein